MKIWHAVAIGTFVGATGGWLVAIGLALAHDGQSLLINSDTVGAGIGAFLAIAGSQFVSHLNRNAEAKCELEKQRRAILSIFSLLEAELRLGTLGQISDNITRDMAVEVSRRVLKRLERAADTGRQALNEMKGTERALLEPLRTVQIELADSISRLEYHMPLAGEYAFEARRMVSEALGQIDIVVAAISRARAAIEIDASSSNVNSIHRSTS